VTAPRPRAAGRLLVPALGGLLLAVPVLAGAILAAVLQSAEPGTRVYVTMAPSLLAGAAGLAGSAALGTVLLVRRRTARAAEAARAAVRDAEARAAEDRRRFLLRLDHELKNPLTAIHAGLANVEHAATSGRGPAAASSGTPAEEALSSVSAQANRITRLLGDLRKLADLETREIETAPVDLPGLLTEVEEAVSVLPGASERTIRMTIPRAPWPLPLIDGDRDLIFIALQNLVANAVKFSAPGDTVEMRASEDGSWVVLEVADTGAGIPEDETDEVWHELARGRAARSIPGTGIGLALVRVVAIRHGGRVALRSRDGQGTVVSIRLPVQARTGTAPAVAELRQRRDPRGKVSA
jgi:two-component system OmpR family sensor kinase